MPSHAIQRSLWVGAIASRPTVDASEEDVPYATADLDGPAK